MVKHSFTGSEDERARDGEFGKASNFVCTLLSHTYRALKHFEENTSSAGSLIETSVCGGLVVIVHNVLS